MPTSPSVNNVDTPPSTSLELAEVSNDKKPTLLETSEKDEHIFNDVKTQEIIQVKRLCSLYVYVYSYFISHD